MDLKQQVLAAIDVEREARDILGNKHRNGNYSCYKAAHSNNDANPSLSMNDKGLYLCHSCGVKGDIFQLLMDTSGLNRQADFGKLLKQLAARYGLQANTVKFEKEREVVQVIKGFKLLDDDNKKKWLLSRRAMGNEALQVLEGNYGISKDTALRFGLGFEGRRLWIPIPAKGFQRKAFQTDLVNVRKHDILRKCCQWIDTEGNKHRSQAKGTRPYWGDRGGKTIGIRNHNVAYVYPMEKLTTNLEVWLVGGELKALLLNQLGIHAVCFTAGEGRYHKKLLKFFTNKIVRVVMDIDDAGERATFEERWPCSGARGQWGKGSVRRQTARHCWYACERGCYRLPAPERLER